MLGQQGVNPEPALIDYLADRPTDSVRSLVGLLQRVVRRGGRADGPLSAGLAREVLEGQSPRDTRRSSGFPHQWPRRLEPRRHQRVARRSCGDWVDVADR